jgi:hypothetical protein
LVLASALLFLAVRGLAALRFGLAAANVTPAAAAGFALAPRLGLAARFGLAVAFGFAAVFRFGVALEAGAALAVAAALGFAVLRVALRRVAGRAEAARGVLAIIRRTASVAAVTMAAPILLALSAALSAPSSASRPAFFALLRTLSLVESAAAAATRPAASMLRASGFCASSASLSAAAPTLVLPDLPPALPSDFAIAVSYAIVTDP